MIQKVNLINEAYKILIENKKDTFLEKFRKENKLQPYRIKQIFYEIFKNNRIDFDSMTTLSKDLRKNLEEKFEILSLQPVKIEDSIDSTKIVFQTKDWNIIESVLMYHYHTINWKTKLNRITLCVSSQIGCPVWCIFCVTWKLWFRRNLSLDEIISQLIFANNFVMKKFGKKEDWSRYKVRNIVFMWMGEPLLNYENIKKSIWLMLDQRAFSLSKRHITISTSWIIPWIYRLIEDKLPVMLAVSLHAPNQRLREKLIPIAKQYPLEKLMEILNQYINKLWNRIFYEYIMIKWLTDKPDLAYELVKLLKWQKCHINLIPYNENPAIDLKESTYENILKFKKILENWWLTVTIRDSLWREIKWACGQLGYEFIKKIN